MLVDEPLKGVVITGPGDPDEVGRVAEALRCLLDRGGFTVADASSGCPEPEHRRFVGEVGAGELPASDERCRELQCLGNRTLDGRLGSSTVDLCRGRSRSLSNRRHDGRARASGVDRTDRDGRLSRAIGIASTGGASRGRQEQRGHEGGSERRRPTVVCDHSQDRSEARSAGTRGIGHVSETLSVQIAPSA